MLGSREIELPYDRIDGVQYNDGMISSGVEFRGSTIEPYSFYFDHNNKAGIKGRARRFADCVRQRLPPRTRTRPPTPPVATQAPNTVSPDGMEDSR